VQAFGLRKFIFCAELIQYKYGIIWDALYFIALESAKMTITELSLRLIYLLSLIIISFMSF
jgi:hypothetical protein